MSTLVTLRGNGRHEHHGEESHEIEQSLPILGLPIHEHITVHEIVTPIMYFSVMSTMVTLRGHGRHEHHGEESQELEQSLPVLGLQIHEHITVHEIVNPRPYFSICRPR